LRGDEAVNLPEKQSVLGLEQLDPGDLGPAPGAGGRRRCAPGRFLRCGDAEDDESNVVARVVPHDLLRRGGPVQPLRLPAGVLDDDRRRLRRLAVAHGAPCVCLLLARTSGGSCYYLRSRSGGDGGWCCDGEGETGGGGGEEEEESVVRLPFLRWWC
jgi:hypothetical protein